MRMTKASPTSHEGTRTDVLTAEQRSRCMSKIHGKNTEPEKLVRSLVYSLGYRYRLNDRRLPGSPDLVFIGRHKVIFVHGCFWHMHDCRNGRATPKANAEFWKKKRLRTVQRDQETVEALRECGWDCLTIWECEIKDKAALVEKIRFFLEKTHGQPRRRT